MNPLTFLKRHRSLNALWILSWMAVIFAASSTPGEYVPGSVSPYANLLHFIEYLVLGLLVMVYVWDVRRPLLTCVLFCALWGASDEFHQVFVPGRSPSMWDILVDSIGGFAGGFAARRLGRL